MTHHLKCSLSNPMNLTKDESVENNKQNYSRIEVLLKNNNKISPSNACNSSAMKMNNHNISAVLNQIPSNIPCNKEQSPANNSSAANSNANISHSTLLQNKQSTSTQILKKKNSFIHRKTIRNYTAAAAASSLPTSAADNCLIVTQPSNASAQNTASFNIANSLLLLQPAQATKQEQPK